MPHLNRPADQIRVIEIGSSHVALAEFSRQKTGRLKVTKFAHAVFPYDAASQETVSRAAKTAVAEVLARWGRKRRPIRVVIPGHWTLAKGVKVPAVARAHRDKVIQFEARQCIPFSLDEVEWDYEVLEETDAELAVLFAAAKAENVASCVQWVRQAGFEPDAVHSAGLASRWVQEQSPDSAGPETGASLQVIIGARSTHLLFKDDRKLLLRTLSLGGSLISRGIAERLAISTVEAESVKLEVCRDEVDPPTESPASQVVIESVEAFRTKLRGEIKRSEITFRRQYDGGEPVRIILAGGAAQGSAIQSWLQNEFHRPVQRLDALAGVDLAPEVVEAIERFGRGQCGDLVGAAMAPTGEAATLNLLPKSVRAIRIARARRPRWLAAAALVLVALVLPGIHYAQIARARESAMRTLSQELGPVAMLHERNQNYNERLDTLEREAKNLRELQQARRAWVSFLADLQQCLQQVEDGWFERVLILPSEPGERRAAREDAGKVGPDAVVPSLPLRLRFSGRLLDRENPLSRVSQSSYERVTLLLSRIGESEFVEAVEGERFDASALGILRFDFTVVVNPRKRL